MSPQNAPTCSPPTLYRRRSGPLSRRAATATEYLLIMVFVVMPLALLMPMFMRMITNYSGRVFSSITWPFP